MKVKVNVVMRKMKLVTVSNQRVCTDSEATTLYSFSCDDGYTAGERGRRTGQRDEG